MLDLNDMTHLSSNRGDTVSSPLLDLVGIRLRDRYEIGSRIALSLYSEIFIATDWAPQNDSQRKVVVKALNLALNGPLDPDLERTLIENMATEVAALQRLHHRNIIQLIECGNDLDRNSRSYFYILLEYMKGGDLASLCRNQPLRLERALFYLTQIRDALSYAHDSGVIHRDIKPQNLLLSGDRNVVKLSDFGTCRLDRLTGAITQVGTADYSPPEHFSRAQETSALTPASDVYALAKTFWFLMSGRPPSRFSQREISELPDTVITHPWATAILVVLRKATRDHPLSRHQSVNDFWDDLCYAAGDLATMSSSSRSTRCRPGVVIDIGRSPRERNLHREEGFPQIQPHRREILHKLALKFSSLRKRFERVLSNSRVPQNAPLPKTLVGQVVIVFLAVLLLFGSYQFINARLRGSPQTSVRKKSDSSQVRRTGTTITNVNIRPNPSTDNSPVGLADRGSRVQILRESGDQKWYEVVVNPCVSTKADQESVCRGWVNKRFLILY